MKGRITVRNDASREIQAGTDVRDPNTLDVYTVTRTTKVRRNWLVRLLARWGLWPWGRARAKVPAVRGDRLEKR